MSHRRDQKERLRREREQREAEAQAAQQRKRLFGVAGAVAMVVAAIVIVVVLSGGGGGDTAKSAGNNYPQNPPTSGKHFAVPAEDGLYNGAPPTDTALVHSLEHGRIIVWANPSLPVEARKQLRALYEQDNYQMIFVRRPNMPYAVAATAWSHDPTPDGTGRLMGCPNWDDGVIDALRAFRDEHRSNGPEDIP